MSNELLADGWGVLERAVELRRQGKELSLIHI